MMSMEQMQTLFQQQQQLIDMMIQQLSKHFLNLETEPQFLHVAHGKGENAVNEITINMP